MIQHVYERAKLVSAFSEVVVATDDERIFRQVESFGGNVVMTAPAHPSGSDRCAEVAARMQTVPDVVVNVQGDVPFVAPGHLQQVLDCFQNPDTQIATLVKKITDNGTLNNPNTPKVVFDAAWRALYFSRSPIPYFRNADQAEWHQKHTYYKHIGIYGYRGPVLQEIVKLPPAKLEMAESLEQLRWLEHGYTIQLAETTSEALAIDTPGDLSLVLSKMDGGTYID